MSVRGDIREIVEQTRESAEGIRTLLAVKMDIKFEAISIELQRIQSQTHRKIVGIPKNIFIYLFVIFSA